MTMRAFVWLGFGVAAAVVVAVALPMLVVTKC
jgi:hypothetical protein